MDLSLIDVCKIRSDMRAQRIETDEEKMSELVASIREDGLNQPIKVSASDDGYDVVFGHRRLEACKRLGWTQIPAIIAQGDEAQIRSMTFSENFFRENLTAVEQSIAIADEVKSGRMTVEKIASCFHRKPDWVRRQISICGWPPDVLDGIHNGKLSVSAAENLACITEDNYRESLVRQAVDNGATARTTSAWLQAWRAALPLENTLEIEAQPGQNYPVPLVPQAPCLVCKDIFRTDELCHVPLCQHCIKVLNNAQNAQQQQPMDHDYR